MLTQEQCRKQNQVEISLLAASNNEIKPCGHDHLPATVSTLQHFKHSTSDLVAHLVSAATVTSGSMTRTQRKAYYHLLNLIQATHQYPSTPSLTSSFVLFDDLFFSSKLAENCIHKPAKVPSSNLDLCCDAGTRYLGNGRAMIFAYLPPAGAVDLPFYKEKRYAVERMTRYFESLLHQMVHAFLMLFPCFECRIQGGGVGKEKGHCEHWEEVKGAVEKMCREKLRVEAVLEDKECVAGRRKDWWDVGGGCC
ncbi:hypothetical protein BJ875DRAFT_482984 [Amylocarpus encephaloides]|uniref:Uncharacterized protein n=1 Tax=Amylocarpus encephaloides TaxID=45428 RepID=A0A9P7YLC0_9HELO|nr:hypothetical protein BJ875DRAFT_482984 [Amylocarpus encephaloides]